LPRTQAEELAALLAIVNGIAARADEDRQERRTYETEARADRETIGTKLQHLEQMQVDANSRLAKVEPVVSMITSLHAKVIDGEVVLNGKTGLNARLTNWSFGQLASKAKAPASYLSTLPAELVVDCLNNGLAKIDEGKSKLLINDDGPLTVRAINGVSYGRIWDHEVTEQLLRLKAQGWHEAPAAFDGSRGQYRGDRSMFSFLVDSDRRIFEKAPGGGLSRGLFAWNSEVGGGTFGGMRFCYNYICGNHYVWGASDVSEFKIRHVGNAAERGWPEWDVLLRKYRDSSAVTQEMEIEKAMQFQIAATKADVFNAVFGLKAPTLTKANVTRALEIAEQREDWYGNPLSAWGVASGLTEIARDLPNADDRIALERGAGKVIEMAF
jgi:hypothetical protein